jgi:hypothetical protein
MVLKYTFSNQVAIFQKSNEFAAAESWVIERLSVRAVECEDTLHELFLLLGEAIEYEYEFEIYLTYNSVISFKPVVI